MFKSQFLNELKERKDKNGFFHLTNSKEERNYIRENGCTYVRHFGYGCEYATIKDKRTKEKINIPIYSY